MTDVTTFATVGITAAVTAVTAIASVIITYVLTKKREHETDWRKLKFGQYQEFVLALSGVVRERATPDGHRRYADAVNIMALVATPKVLLALKDFQTEISYINNRRSDERHDVLLDTLLRAMRDDLHPKPAGNKPKVQLKLLGLPPDATS